MLLILEGNFYVGDGGTALCHGAQDSTASCARQAHRGLPWAEEEGPTRVRTEGGGCQAPRGPHVYRPQGCHPASERLGLRRSCGPDALVGWRGGTSRSALPRWGKAAVPHHPEALQAAKGPHKPGRGSFSAARSA
jgi:hypothetical protein